MKMPRSPALVLCFLLVSLTATAQQSTTAQAPVATAAPSPLSFTQQIRNTVAFLTVAYKVGPDTKGAIGTCFMVFVEDKRLGEDRGLL